MCHETWRIVLAERITVCGSLPKLPLTPYHLPTQDIYLGGRIH